MIIILKVADYVVYRVGYEASMIENTPSCKKNGFEVYREIHTPYSCFLLENRREMMEVFSCILSSLICPKG